MNLARSCSGELRVINMLGTFRPIRAYFFQESHSARLEKQIFLLIKNFEF